MRIIIPCTRGSPVKPPTGVTDHLVMRRNQGKMVHLADPLRTITTTADQNDNTTGLHTIAIANALQLNFSHRISFPLYSLCPDPGGWHCASDRSEEEKAQQGRRLKI